MSQGRGANVVLATLLVQKKLLCNTDTNADANAEQRDPGCVNNKAERIDIKERLERGRDDKIWQDLIFVCHITFT